MSIKLGFTKSSIAFAVALLTLNMTVQAGAVYDYIKSNNELTVSYTHLTLPTNREV